MENNNKFEEQNSCACGGSCCSGHNHDEHHHEHHHDCCCSSHKEVKIDNLSEDENAFINYLMTYNFLPVVRFVLRSSKEDSFLVQALAPVYIDYKDDTMEKVKFVGSILTSLEEKGIIDIDYDVKLNNYDYSEYYESDLYKQFLETVEQSKANPDFLGDIPELETGSIAMTEEYSALV